MSAPILIGFSGKLGSGKTTASTAVSCAVQEMDVGACCRTTSFATPLRRVLCELTGVKPQHTRSAADKARSLGAQWGNMTIGQALQRLGTDAIRTYFHQDSWVNAAMVGCDSTDPAAERRVWIFDDVRFENEAEAIRKRGGFLVRIERPESESCSDASGRCAEHPSETALDCYEGFDAVVTNTGGRSEFEVAIVAAVTPFLRRALL